MHFKGVDRYSGHSTRCSGKGYLIGLDALASGQDWAGQCFICDRYHGQHRKVNGRTFTILACRG